MRRYSKLYPLKGPGSRQSQKQLARWAAMTPEQRTHRVDTMQAALPRSRSEDTRRRMSAANRAAWARKREGRSPEARNCLSCKRHYIPADWRSYYCTLDCRRLYGRLRRYGLTNEQYSAILNRQGGVCALCKGAWRGWGQGNGPHIDHDHQTGVVRGILCGDCNTAIGRFGDDPALLRRAADYLERSTITPGPA